MNRIEREMLGETLDEHYDPPCCPECGETERIEVEEPEPDCDYKGGVMCYHPACEVNQ